MRKSQATMLIPDHNAMVRLGIQLVETMQPGGVFLLHGDLGVGKTTITQGIALGLGLAEPVQSPTFTLASEHRLARSVRGIDILYHVDLYRLNETDDLESIDWERFIRPSDGISVIEWPERAGSWLPCEFTLVRIEYAVGGRHVVIEQHSLHDETAHSMPVDADEHTLFSDG